MTEMTEQPTAIAIVSGGLDSVTLAYLLRRDYPNHRLHLLSFDYGQRHVKELASARTCAGRLEAEHTLMDLRSVGSWLYGSALTDRTMDVPEGHYAAENMRSTVVPNRNAIMLAIAYGVAVSEQAELVATAIHAGDHFIYPDCRPRFARLFDEMEAAATAGFARPNLHLHTPFIQRTKAEIVALGVELGVPFADTWSCYVGGPLHCGKCGTCVERKEAFVTAGVPDPTLYAESILA